MVDLHIAQRLEKPVREKIGSCCSELFVKTVTKTPFSKRLCGNPTAIEDCACNVKELQGCVEKGCVWANKG